MEPYDTLRKDGTMASLVEDFGHVTVEPVESGEEFRRLVVSITNQSVSTESARAVRGRLFDALDDVTPRVVLDTSPEELASTGVGEAKAEYLHETARAFENGDYGREAFAGASNDEVRDALTEIRGVGKWTANMYLIFVLGREDVLPLGDLAVRRGIEGLYGVETRDEMREIAETWKPYRSYGTRYVWKWYEL
ncbi:MAG: DNA-3-methyladenine glycosylase 2 family protein [Halobacteriales archaeon]|nr:DNA-3-methyladenine glycosylase 2 family protein [Halobacteriales archaeon]